VPDLLRLLTHTVPEEDLPTYGELSPGMPDMAIFGSLADALERVSSDPVARADIGYTAIMFAGALVKVVAAAARRIEELEARLDEQLTSKPKAAAKK
jgi:hypothetical protein